MSTECLICLESIDDQKTDIPVLKCNCKGDYHDKCINEWFIAKGSIVCPICLSEFNDTHIIVLRTSYLESSNKYCDLDCFICVFKLIILITSASVIFFLVIISK